MILKLKNTHKSFKHLTILYILALSLIAFLTIAAQIIIQSYIKTQYNDSRLVNLSGRQRFQSQGIVKMTLILTDTSRHLSAERKEYYLQRLDKYLNSWHTHHFGLKNGNLPEYNIVQHNSDTLNMMFNNLEHNFLTVYENVLFIKKSIEADFPITDTKIRAAVDTVLAHEFTFLDQMDRIVYQYDKEAQARVQQLKKIEMYIMGSTLLMLLLEAFFIFLPVSRSINKNLQDLTASKKDLEILYEELLNTNDSLIKTKNELVRTTEEKFRLEMQKEKVRSASIIEGQEEERKRLSLELHDGLGQMLTGLKLISEKFNLNALGNEKDQKTFIDLKKLIDDTIAETRTISFNLMPSVLHDFGIVSAIKLLVEQTQKNASINIEFYPDNVDIRFNPALEVMVYRICQEALTNAIKHAEASEIIIDLYKKDDFLFLEVKDDGKGIDNKKSNNKLIKNGIRNMQTRATLIDADFKILSTKGKGTRIYIKVPLI